MIILIPKADGGRRPIGLFPTIIRVWMRARAAVARQWEDDTQMPELFGGKGMGAQRASWVAAARFLGHCAERSPAARRSSPVAAHSWQESRPGAPRNGAHA